MVPKIERGDRSSDAFICGLSSYCEEEFVFPPLCNLARVGQPTMSFDDNGTAVTEVPVSITVDGHASECSSPLFVCTQVFANC